MSCCQRYLTVQPFDSASDSSCTENKIYMYSIHLTLWHCHNFSVLTTKLDSIYHIRTKITFSLRELKYMIFQMLAYTFYWPGRGIFYLLHMRQQMLWWVRAFAKNC